jgi:hypothetical protein
MKLFLLISLLSTLLIAPVSIVAGGKDQLVIKVKVEKIQESAFAPEVEPPEDSYLVVVYKVLKVCKGKYQEDEIKGAHFGDTTKDLKIGDELFIRIKPTQRFRETAKFALEDFGIVIPEESLADFVFVETITM